jgi:CheY-like chemotaxis protein
MSPKHILLVDDEDDIREVAALSLEAVGGRRVSSASDGASGVVMARAARPDAILLDVMMPGLDGPATVARLREDPLTRDIPVILLTAKAQTSDRLRFAALGVAGTLT